MDLVGLSLVTEATGHVRRMSSVNHTEIHNYTEINQLLGGEICWNFFWNTSVFLYFSRTFSLFLMGFEKFLDAFFDFCHFEVAGYCFIAVFYRVLH